jgi:uncharacterized glyoxalase superfamily protein PhnB
LNPFALIHGEGGATAFIEFVCAVFEARETLATHALDADDLLIHAEMRIGDSTLMCCDAKPDWPFTPSMLQVYVVDAGAVIDRARANGADVITDPTDFFGRQRLARFRDRWHNIWWLFEYGEASTSPAEGPNELPSWKPDPDAPPSYAHETICSAMRDLKPSSATSGQ